MVRHELADQLDTFTSHHRQDYIVQFSEDGLSVDGILAMLSFQGADVDIPSGNRSFIRLLATFSIRSEDVFTGYFPLSSHVEYLQKIPSSALRPFFKGIVSYYSKSQGLPSADGRQQEKDTWEMQTLFPLLTLVVRLIDSDKKACKIFEEEGLFDLLEILWQKSNLSPETQCRQIRVWIVIALGEVVYQLSFLNRYLFITNWNFIMDEVYTEGVILEQALSTRSVVHHLLVLLADIEQ